MKQEKIELAKQWYADRGFSVKEYDDTLMLKVDGYEFELSYNEIEYRASLIEEELLTNKNN